MMGHINCKDHALIKRWWKNKKMNVMGMMFDEKEGVIVKSDFHVLLEVVSIFEVMEFTAT